MSGRALAELVLLGAALAPLGVWVLLFRSSFAAESLAHGMLPGLVAAVALGAPIVLGGIAGAALAAVLIAAAGADRRLGTDTGISIVTTALFGAGSLIAAAGGVEEHDIEPLLFGDLSAVSNADLALAGALAVASPLVLLATHRRLGREAFDDRPAPLAVLALLGIGVAVAVEAVGALLALALVVGPAAGALAVARRLPAALAGAGLAAIGAAALGLAVADPLGVPEPSAVALAAVAAAPLAALPRLARQVSPS